MTSAHPECRLHASAVAFDMEEGWKALLITGASGSGKSELALELMALGARLVADDQTVLTPAQGRIMASAPEAIGGLIEMRAMGLLAAHQVQQAEVVTIVDMDQQEMQRMPTYKTRNILGHEIRVLHRIASRAFPAALRQYMLMTGWQKDPAEK